MDNVFSSSDMVSGPSIKTFLSSTLKSVLLDDLRAMSHIGKYS